MRQHRARASNAPPTPSREAAQPYRDSINPTTDTPQSLDELARDLSPGEVQAVRDAIRLLLRGWMLQVEPEPLQDFLAACPAWRVGDLYREYDGAIVAHYGDSL